MNETETIKDVFECEDIFCISTNTGTGFNLEKRYVTIPPKAGDKVKLYCVHSSLVRGVELNDVILYYKSDRQLEQERQEWLDNNVIEKQDRFEKNKSQMDSDYESLPTVFKQRIDRFRKNNPDFRVDYEAYELFSCKEAVKIANACKTVKNIEKFKNGESSLVPNLDDGHSGNTFDCACYLARMYLESPDFVRTATGAMVHLVGSKDYGDME